MAPAGPPPAGGDTPDRSWPKKARLLRRRDFEAAYEAGRRHHTPFFVAFLHKTESPQSKIGFTAPRALGRAVERNRIRRRMREAVRLHRSELPSGWHIVFNLRRVILEVEFARLEREVLRLFASLR